MSFSRTDNATACVLVIEADPLMLTALGSLLDMQGYRVILARTIEVASTSIAERSIDVIILSIDQLEAGCRFAERLRGRAETADTPIVFLVPELKPEWANSLSAQGGVFSVQKPIDPVGLIDAIDRSLWMPHLAGNRGGSLHSHLATSRDWIRL